MSIVIEDRITQLLSDPHINVTGIDFIYVYPNQQKLDIYFIKPVTLLVPPLPGTLTPDDVSIYSPQSELPVIDIITVSWPIIDGQTVLQLLTKQPGDFSLYKLKIHDLRIDSHFNDISFSFKANCSRDLDCKPGEPECPPEEMVDVSIDYLARDFWSYRRALLDFASLRYPAWPDRLEADAAVMLAEMMSAIGDEMAYYQDRIAREAYLETATQRRSIRTLARLVDYNMHDGLGSKAWLELTVTASPGEIPIMPGTAVYASGSDNSAVNFEIGYSIRDQLSVPPQLPFVYNVNQDRNSFDPHIWDDDEICLPVNSTELYLKRDLTGILHFDDLPAGKLPGKWVLLQTNPTDPGQPARAQMVRLIKIELAKDLVFNEHITHIVWEQEQALKSEFDLTILKVKGNMVPATAGKTTTAYFIIGKSPEELSVMERNAFGESPVEQTVERNGINGSVTHLTTLPGTDTASLVYLGKDLQHAKPEIVVEQVELTGSGWKPIDFEPEWECKKSFVGTKSSGPSEKHFMLDDGSWQRVAGYQRPAGEFIHRDYASNKGVTIRFGDGEFGRIPGKDTVFRVRFRVGGGWETNVAAGSIKYPATGDYTINNPSPAVGGLDPETPDELRQLAPDAFRAITYRAVRPEDYAEAAERLSWVQKAGAAFRWTGSWLTAFVTPDPKGKITISEAERKILIEQLNRFRQAGRQVHVSDPEYANIDIEIHICVSPEAYPGKVKEKVYNALMGTNGLYPRQGYFSPDRFTFGTFLDRSTLEAAIQEVPGVRAVELVRFRRRGWFTWRDFFELNYDPGRNAIIRIANDPLHPERGLLKLYTHGGL